MAPPDDPEPADTAESPPADGFESAEPYYAAHRPSYGDEVIEYLVGRFDLDGESRVLDLGCGAGQIAVPLAARVGHVVGMDPNETMLEYAEQRAAEASRENVEWVVGTDADLRDDCGSLELSDGLSPLDLTTMGRAFHRMNQDAVLETLADLTAPGGGVAILNDPEWLTKGTADWQEEVYAVASDYRDDLPERTGPVEYDDPWDELLADHDYRDVAVDTFPFEREWTVDGVVGYVFSLSFCAPATFGDDHEAFEAVLREQLGEGKGPFVQRGEVTVISGTVPEDT